MTVTMDDPYDLQRFIAAQDPVYQQVTAELAAGAKASHWMWFVFPQLQGLGRSATARHFGITSKEEALAYWKHPVLGARLKECCGRVMSVKGKTALQIFGSVDALKFRSCLTLFEQVAPQEPLFRRLLAQLYGDERDTATLDLL